MNSNNNKIINDSYGRPQDLILLFKIRMGTRKDSFEIYRKFGQAPTKRLASPGLYGYFSYNYCYNVIYSHTFEGNHWTYH